MKNFILIITFLLAATLANAQLRGSGKTITKTFDYPNFDKVYFEDIDGKIEVEIGKKWSISVTIDDNLQELLKVSENKSEYAVTIAFIGNKNNKMYIEDTNVKIKITMPEASVIKHEGNSILIVKNIVGRYFRLENSGNGIATISGTIDNLDIINNGNGVANAKQLNALRAKIKCTGNGDAEVNASETITAKTFGNSTVINYGKAKFDTESSSSGNSSFKNKN